MAVEKKAGHIKNSKEKNKKPNKVMFNSFDQSRCVDSKSLANNLVLVLTQRSLTIQMECSPFPINQNISNYKNQFYV